MDDLNFEDLLPGDLAFVLVRVGIVLSVIPCRNTGTTSVAVLWSDWGMCVHNPVSRQRISTFFWKLLNRHTRTT